MYCAEQFKNDQSIGTTVFKNIKRAMAGEYSRELSNRTFAGQKRIAEMGRKVGGMPYYGYRRMLVGPDGKRKGILKRGQRKSIDTDRVILVPDPAEEIGVVRWIYRTYARGHTCTTKIADILAKRGVPPPGKRWTQQTIQRILTCETYIGNTVWNRKSRKLKSKAVWNDPDLWVRFENAHEPIVDCKLFLSVQKVLATRRTPRFTSDGLLHQLKSALKRHGKLTQELINADPRLPHTHSYWTRFGSLLRAYELIGYRPSQRMLTREKNRPITGWKIKGRASRSAAWGASSTK